MLTLIKYILITLIILLFAQCTSKQNVESPTDFNFNVEFTPTVGATIVHPTSYIGEWSYSFPFYDSKLFINEDGTFTYHEQGCLGHGYSEGKWTKFGSTILLNSLEKYTKNKFPEYSEVTTQSNSETPKKMKKKGEFEYIVDPSIFNVTATNKLGPGDTTNVYFDKAQFRIDGDNLYRLDKNGLLTDTKYLLVKSNG